MPSGGQISAGSGIRLQANYPGVTDLGNEHISGVVQSDTGARPYLAYPKTIPVYPSGGQNIMIGGPASFAWGVQADDIQYCIFIGDGQRVQTNPNGGNINSGVNIGTDQWIQEPGGTCIGGFAENGTTGAYPLASNYGTVYGYAAKAWSSWGSFGGDTVIGANAISGASRASASPAECSTILGFQCRSTGAGRNILVGAKTTTAFRNSILLVMNHSGNYAGTQDNQIKIGDSSHTKIEIGPYDFTNGNAASSTDVNDANTNVTASIGTVNYKSITLPRTVNLPAANSVSNGFRVLVYDSSGSVTGVNTITIARAGADTINGVASSVISTAYGCRELISDGNSKWTIIRSL